MVKKGYYENEGLGFVPDQKYAKGSVCCKIDANDLRP